MFTKLICITCLLQIIISWCNSDKKIINNIQKSPEMEQSEQTNPESMSTSYSSPAALVLQILPDKKIGKTTVNGKEAYRSYALIFIPNPDITGSTISCPLNYFQESASLPENWILNDSGQKINISNANKFKSVILTKKVNGQEEIIDLPDEYSERILNYFYLDVPHNEQKFKGYDCYAFVSSISNVKYYPLKPDFEYQDRQPNLGDIVVLASGNNLPESIKHWAIYLGDNQYLSKFGRSGEKASSLITVMDLEGMKELYDCSLIYVAFPKPKAKPWEEYKP